MVADEIEAADELKPHKADVGEKPAFAGDWRWKDDVKGADSIRRNDKDLVRAVLDLDAIHVSDFALLAIREGEIRLVDSGVVGHGRKFRRSQQLVCLLGALRTNWVKRRIHSQVHLTKTPRGVRVSVATFRFNLDERTGVKVGRPPVGVRMVGPGDARTRAEIRFRETKHGGVFSCTTKDIPDAALRVQADLGDAGVLMLQTCLLPPREEPYDLSVELARHRIKMFIQKSEDWQMFDPAMAPRAVETFEEARNTFTNALISPDGLECGRLAVKSLIRCMHATDKLAHAHADILLHHRYRTQAASKPTFGTAISLEDDPDAMAESLRNFGLLSMPLVWRDLEPKQGAFSFKALDKWLAWAAKTKTPVILGPLVDVRDASLPDWVKALGNDYASLRDAMYDYMDAVVARYVASVGIWKISSGLHIVRDRPLKPTEMVDLTRTAVVLVRQYRRGARTMIELDDLFGDLAAKRAGSLGAFEFLEKIRSEGIHLDCLGARLILGGNEPSQRSRDLMMVSDRLDEFFHSDFPLLISACGVPSRATGPTAGRWGSAWSEDQQAAWASRIVPIALSKPYVEAVVWSCHKDLKDSDGFGLLDHAGVPRPAHAKLMSMRRRLNSPLGFRTRPDKPSGEKKKARGP
jgi:hypothetical protein